MSKDLYERELKHTYMRMPAKTFKAYIKDFQEHFKVSAIKNPEDFYIRLGKYIKDGARRPCNQDTLLQLREYIVAQENNKEEVSEATSNMQTMHVEEILTEAQIRKAHEIITDGGPRVRDRLVEEVLIQMKPPKGVSKKSEGGFLKQYGPFLPQYLAYALIHYIPPFVEQRGS